MNQKELDKVVKKRLAECTAILRQRGGEYATGADRLYDLKTSATILTACGFSLHGEDITPEGVALLIALIKIARWSLAIQLHRDRTDTRTDLINYALLGEACEKDEPEVTS